MNLQSDIKFNAKDLSSKEMSEIILPIHVMTGCDVTSSFFGVCKRSVWKWVQKSAESQKFLTELLSHNLNEFVTKYIYNGKESNTLTEMTAQKWKNIKNRKAHTFARIGAGVDSNFRRNKSCLLC